MPGVTLSVAGARRRDLPPAVLERVRATASFRRGLTEINIKV
jgi:hypothetical protein